MRKTDGFALVEVMLALAIFLAGILVLSSALFISLEHAARNGYRAEALLLAEEGLECLRNLRDEDYALLVDGSYGLSIESTSFSLTGEPDITGVFTRELTVSDAGTDTKLITVSVTWGELRNAGVVELSTWLSAWPELPPPPPEEPPSP